VPSTSETTHVEIAVVVEIQIKVRIESMFPSADELASRRMLEQGLDEVGRVSGAGAGGGVMDLWVLVEHEDPAVTQIRGLVDRLGLTERTRVSVAAVSEDRDDDENWDPAPAVSSEAVERIANHLLAVGRSQGYVTYDQLNHLLPLEVDMTQAELDNLVSLLTNQGIMIVQDPR
jgi:hypothetical protein